MYLAGSAARQDDGGPAVHPTVGRRAVGVGGTAIALGAVSLLTDLSSEMITAVLPLYLVIDRQQQRLALFTHPGTSGYEHVTQDASQVTVPLLGTDIVVALSELG